MKKLITLILITVLAATMLSGCSKKISEFASRDFSNITEQQTNG